MGLVVVGALRAIGLSLDAIGPAEEIEVVHVITAEERLQREEHVAQLDAQRLDLVAIDPEFDLRDARIETAEDEADLRSLARFGEKILQDLRQLRGIRAATILQHESEAAGSAQAADRRRIEGTGANGRNFSAPLPCRRSWVRVPSSASKTPADRGFLFVRQAT